MRYSLKMKHWRWVWIWTFCFVLFFCEHPLCTSDPSPFGRGMAVAVLKPTLPVIAGKLIATGYTPGAGVKEFVWHCSLLRAAWVNLVTSLISLFDSRTPLQHFLWHFGGGTYTLTPPLTFWGNWGKKDSLQSWAVSASEVGIGSWYRRANKMC